MGKNKVLVMKNRQQDILLIEIKILQIKLIVNRCLLGISVLEIMGLNS